MTTVIDASNLIVGRLASVVAKRALLGEKIDVINSEKAIITGKRKFLIELYKEKTQKGNPLKGPYFPRMPDRMLRRVVRGMLPYKQERGLNAYKRVLCHIGVPEEFKDMKHETVQSASIHNSKALKHMTLGEICKLMKK